MSENTSTLTFDGEPGDVGLIFDAKAFGPPTPIPAALTGLKTFEEVTTNEEIGTNADGSPIFRRVRVPVEYYRKEVAKASQQWTHPVENDQSGAPVTYEFTRGGLDRIVSNFNALAAAGLSPFIPDFHTEAYNAAANNGHVINLRREGDSLYADMKLVGQAAIEKALKNDVSVYVVPAARDAKGKVYRGGVIHHLAFTPRPAQPHLKSYELIAASTGDDRVREAKVLRLAADDLGGRWVTIEGQHVFIKDSAGIVPARVRADAKDNRVSKAAIQRRILQHHHDVGGKGEYTAQDERDLNTAAGAGDAFTFKDKLPTEIKDFMAGRPELRSMFKVTSEAGKAGGADAFGSMGDRYLQIAEAKAGSPLRTALQTAHGSNDPEMQFLAHVHDNLPEGGGKNLQAIQAGGLRVGDEFKVNGEKFRVAEDENGFRVLRSHEYEAPVDALNKIPVDKGSFQRAKGSSGRTKYADAVPFSANGYRSHAARVLNLSTNAPRFRSHAASVLALDAAEGTWVTINGVHVLIGKDGTIKEGPSHMVGKKPSDFGHDGKPDGTKGPNRDLFGRETFDKATGNRQGGLFHEPTTHDKPESERVGSKNASDPKHTQTMQESRDAEEHNARTQVAKKTTPKLKRMLQDSEGKANGHPDHLPSHVREIVKQELIKRGVKIVHTGLSASVYRSHAAKLLNLIG